MKRLNDAAEHLLANIDELSGDYSSNKDNFWDYYRHIRGYIGDGYFSVFFESLNNCCSIELGLITDCKPEVRKILSEWSDLISED